MKLHLYAVSNAASLEPLTGLALTGIGGAPVRAIEIANLAALVSDAVGDAALGARDALLHHAVIERAMVSANLLPARHSVPLTLEVLTTHLTQHRAEYEALLEHIGDAREFGVRAELPPRPADGSAAPRNSGTAYLQARRAQFGTDAARRAELEVVAEAVEAHLCAVALEVKRSYPSADVYRGSFLVRGEDVEAAQRIGLEAVRDLHGVRGSWHGPFPPYSFAVLM